MSCFLHLLLLLELQTLTLKTSRIYHRSHKPDPDFERYLTIFMLHYGAWVFHSISALSSFRVVTILHPSVVWCLAMQLGVMRLHVLCFFLGSQCKLHLKHLLHTIRLGTPWWKMPLILSCQKDLLLQSAICNLHANHFGNCLCKEREFRNENSSLPVNCNYVSLWINESQSYTWILKSRTFL